MTTQMSIKNIGDFLFQSPKGDKDTCLICSDEDNMTDQYLTCCQKPVCRSCFVEWYTKRRNMNCFSGETREKCIHCNVEFDDPIQYTARTCCCCNQTTSAVFIVAVPRLQ